MRGISTLAILSTLLVVPAAQAQDNVVSLMCQARPTQRCVLEMAVAATESASAQGNDNLPWGRIVETASRAGELDIALRAAPKMNVSAIAPSELVAAAARAGRLAEAEPILAAFGKTPADLAYALAPVYIELGRTEDLQKLLASVAPPPDRMSLDEWHVRGHLMPGRTAEAKARLDAIPAETDRADVAAAASQMLVIDGAAEAARPLLPYLDGPGSFQVNNKARLAAAWKDAHLALSLVPMIDGLPAEDKPYAIDEISHALAQAGEWRKAVELADTLPADDRATRLASIAAVSGEPQVFALLEKAMKEASDDGLRDRLRRLLVSALVRAGYPAATYSSYIQQGESQYEMDNLTTFAAAALAARGQVSEAVVMARGIADPHRRAWAIWQVASDMKD